MNNYQLTAAEVAFLLGGIHLSIGAIEQGFLPLSKSPLQPQEMWLLVQKLQGLSPAAAAQLRAGIDAQRALNEAIKKVTN